MRFPYPKAMIEMGGHRIIDRTVEMFSDIFEKVVISTNEPERYFYLGVPMAGDVMPQRGPMTGMVSAFAATEASEIFFAACDMPFISPDIVRWIASMYDGSNAFVPVYRNEPQPLLGVYSSSVAPAMASSIISGRRGLKGFLRTVGASYIDWDELSHMDPEGKTFVNINTIDDYQKYIGLNEIGQSAATEKNTFAASSRTKGGS